MNVCVLCGRRPAEGIHRLIVERSGRKRETRALACGECLWLLRLGGERGHRFWETGGHWYLPARR